MEKVDGERHVPEYRKGCWGKPGAKKCWLCRFRMPVKFAKLVYRMRQKKKELKTDSDEIKSKK